MTGDEARAVAFSSVGSGPLPLTWSQQWVDGLCAELGELAYRINLKLVLPIPPGNTVPDVLAMLKRTVEAHDALRLVPIGGSGTGRMQQVVSEGTLDVAVRGAPRSADTAAVAAAVAVELASRRFAAGEMPIRAAIVSRDGVPEHLSMALSHHSVDGWARQLLRLSLERGQGAAAEPGLGVGRWPVDKVAQESGAAGARSRRKTRAYWTDQIAAMSTGSVLAALPDRPTPRHPRYWNARVLSAAGGRSVRLLADRYQSGVPAVLLAALTQILAACSSVAAVPWHLVLANRNSWQSREELSCRANTMLALVRVPASGSLRDSVANARAASLSAQLHGDHDAHDLADVLESAAQTGARPLHVPFQFNFQSRPDSADQMTAPDARPDENSVANTFTWIDRLESNNVSLYVHAWMLRGDLGLELHTDTGFVGPEQTKGIAVAVEHLLVQAARGVDDLRDLAGICQAWRETDPRE